MQRHILEKLGLTYFLKINVEFICSTSNTITAWYKSFAVNPPSDLNFKIINEHTVQMSWKRPPDSIEGYRITVAFASVGKYSYFKDKYPLKFCSVALTFFFACTNAV